MRYLKSPAIALALAASMVVANSYPVRAQDLVDKVNGRMADKPDPLQLIRDSAAYVQEQDGLSLKLLGTRHITAGERDQRSQEVFELKLSQPNLYSVAMVKPQPEFWVRSNGEKMMTYIAPLSRYAVTEGSDGISDFSSSQLSKMVGNGFGSLAFSLLGAESAEVVIKETEKSEYLGEEKRGEQTVHHARYHSGNLTWDAWFASGAAPMVVRVQPDLSAIAARAPEAQQFKNFKFEVVFDYKDVDAKTAIPTEAFALDAPEDAELVEAEDLFAPPATPPHRLLGKKAPLFDTLNPAGEPIDLAALMGKKVVILDFWATWCGPCVAAMPKINEVAQEYADKGVAFYAVNQGEDAETVNAFLKEQELDVPVAMDQEGFAGNKYAVEGLPTTVIVGKDGRVQVVHVGFSPTLDSKLREELDALLDGKDLAAEELADWQAKHPKRAKVNQETE